MKYDVEKFLSMHNKKYNYRQNFFCACVRAGFVCVGGVGEGLVWQLLLGLNRILFRLNTPALAIIPMSTSANESCDEELNKSTE